MPRGVGNAYQALEDGTAYTYLVNEHWRPDATYVAVAARRPHRGDPVADPPGRRRGLGQGPHEPHARRRHADACPTHADPRRRRPARPGAGRGVPRRRSGSTATELDLTDPDAVAAWPWHEYDARRSTRRRTPPSTRPRRPRAGGRRGRQRHAPARLARQAREHRLTLVHFSTDYVFDGTSDRAHRGRAARHRWASTGRPRPPATSRSRRPLGTTCCAPRGWSATAATSSAPCARWPSGESRPAWSTTRSDA